jgi:flagellar basal-body rod protein FlgF
VLNAQGGTITIPTGTAHVSADGTISVTTADGSAIAGKVGIVNYAVADISAEGTNHFTIRDGAKAIAADAAVQEGSLEGANQDAVHGTMQLLLMQRQAEMMQKALSVFSNDLDKTAAEELGRV